MQKHPFSLEGKTILVTGASSGIGFSTCLLIHKMGGKFIGIGRRDKELKKLIELTSSDSKTIVADLTDELSLEDVVNSIDKIDGLVHSAGITIPHVPLQFYKKEQMERVRSINYDAIVFLMSKLVKSKKINKGGSIVLLASVAGLFGTKGIGIYSGTKGALLATSRVWASELSKQRIRVNSVAPGMVKTDMNDGIIDHLSAEVVAEDEKRYPLGYGEPEDVAAAIVYLLADASKWMTGEVLVIDGGRTSITA